MRQYGSFDWRFNPFYAEELPTIFPTLPTSAPFLPTLLPTSTHALLQSSTVRPDALAPSVGHASRGALSCTVLSCHEMLSQDFAVARRLPALVSFVMISDLQFLKADLSQPAPFVSLQFNIWHFEFLYLRFLDLIQILYFGILTYCCMCVCLYFSFVM